VLRRGADPDYDCRLRDVEAQSRHTLGQLWQPCLTGLLVSPLRRRESRRLRVRNVLNLMAGITRAAGTP
jgi:hypothetical protein